MIERWKRWIADRGGAVALPPQCRVLLVCMGNICRSPTAEGVLRARLYRAGLGERVAVDSAGTQGLHSGEPPDPRAVRQAALRGIDLRALRARGVQPGDFTAFDLILAMDDDNLDALRRRAPAGATARIGLLMAHATRHPGVTVVPDPYYGPATGFDHVLDLVEDACDGLVAQLAGTLGNPSARPGSKLD